MPGSSSVTLPDLPVSIGRFRRRRTVSRSPCAGSSRWLVNLTVVPAAMVISPACRCSRDRHRRGRRRHSRPKKSVGAAPAAPQPRSTALAARRRRRRDRPGEGWGWIPMPRIRARASGSRPSQSTALGPIVIRPAPLRVGVGRCANQRGDGDAGQHETRGTERGPPARLPASPRTRSRDGSSWR